MARRSLLNLERVKISNFKQNLSVLLSIERQVRHQPPLTILLSLQEGLYQDGEEAVIRQSFVGVPNEVVQRFAKLLERQSLTQSIIYAQVNHRAVAFQNLWVEMEQMLIEIREIVHAAILAKVPMHRFCWERTEHITTE
jgi:hypothetical protein